MENCQPIKMLKDKKKNKLSAAKLRDIIISNTFILINFDI
jgi:hypothetical protein